MAIELSTDSEVVEIQPRKTGDEWAPPTSPTYVRRRHCIRRTAELLAALPQRVGRPGSVVDDGDTAIVIDRVDGKHLARVGVLVQPLVRVLGRLGGDRPSVGKQDHLITRHRQRRYGRKVTEGRSSGNESASTATQSGAGCRRAALCFAVSMVAATVLLPLGISPASALEAPAPACAPVVVAIGPGTKLHGGSLAQGGPDRLDTGSMVEQTPPSGSAVMSIRYTGFPAAFQQAFQYAADIWAGVLESPVPITVDASFVPMGPDEVATTEPALDLVPGGSVWYPQALADRLAGQTLDSSAPDMTIDVDSSPSALARWYTGLTGRPGPGQIDLVTAVLHEMGHGLGLSGLFNVNAGAGTVGGQAGKPAIFDTMVADGRDGQPVSTSGNGSAAMAAALDGGDLLFAGPQATLANGDHPVPLYSPTSWASGISAYHTSPVAYPKGSANSLMDPDAQFGVALHDPGPVVEAMLDDLGWVSVPGASGRVSAQVAGTQITLGWTPPAVTGGSPVTGYQVTAWDPEGQVAAQATVAGTAATLASVAAGTTYRIAVRAVNGVGMGSPTEPIVVATPGPVVVTTPAPNPRPAPVPPAHPAQPVATVPASPVVTTLPPVTTTTPTTSPSPQAPPSLGAQDCSHRPVVIVDQRAIEPIASLPSRDGPSIALPVLAAAMVVGGESLRRWAYRRRSR